MKEESRAQKKLETGFKWILTQANIDPSLSWSEVKEKIDLNAPEVVAVQFEEDRIKLYKVNAGVLRRT